MKAFLLEKILQIGDVYLKTSFVSKLNYWRKTLKSKASDLEKLQDSKLKKMLAHASVSSKFYNELGIKEDQDPKVWLKKFPILKKGVFRENIPSILTKPISPDLTEILSSGSTGPPSKVYFSPDELSNNRALQVIWWEWAGYRFGDSILQTGVNMSRSKVKATKDKLLDTRYIDAMSHSKEQILDELRELERFPRKFFIAYASSLYLFAKTALENRITGIRFKACISLGEKLLPQFRDTIEKAFSCKVYDTYGASEGFLIASQCREGNYHLMTPHVFVEILDDEGVEVPDGHLGRVVLTGLDNFTTPLIRYEVGDLAIKSSKKDCSCGLNLPMIDEVVGRITEFLVTPEGKYITVQTVVRILKQFPEVEQFKMVQMDQFNYRLIYISGKPQAQVREGDIKGMFEAVFKESLNITFEKVDSLPKVKTGKFQLIENHYKP